MNIKLVLGLCLFYLLGCKSESRDQQFFKYIKTDELTSYPKTQFPSYNTYFQPDVDQPFSLSQNYPRIYEAESYPWQNVDFKESPHEYMSSVLNYCFEGNIEVDFRGQENKIRKWYHAPWLHDDGKYFDNEYFGNGREFIHGLTRELPTPKFKIHDKQDVKLENWAVGMYNAPGGYTIEKVWKSSPNGPDATKCNFPEGTVSCKLLFTDATVDKVPFLEGSLEWQANIYPVDPKSGKPEDRIRQTRTVRLLQVDIAVKDRRAKDTGWVFGTFVYDASMVGKSVWQKLKVVGLSWGDDTNVVSDLNRDGAFINKNLSQSYIDKNLIFDKNRAYTNEAYLKYHGLGGRLNGPVDNPVSSCISCHGQAAFLPNGTPMPMGDFGSNVNRQNYSLESFSKYFTNVRPGNFLREFDGQMYISCDYSLQISTGIVNYYKSRHMSNAVANRAKQKDQFPQALSNEDLVEITSYITDLPASTRGGN